MVEVLQFIFETPAHFFGTMALMLVAGISGSMLLSPFGRLRTTIFLGSEFDVEDEKGEG